MVRRKQAKQLGTIAACGKLPVYVEKYLRECRAAEEDRKAGRFPNLAGFCRWLGCGIGEVENLRLCDPAAADYLCAVMEDEALNTPAVSPTVVSAYLKRRLGYAEKPDPAVAQAECGEVRLIFEHDITEDGA